MSLKRSEWRSGRFAVLGIVAAVPDSATFRVDTICPSVLVLRLQSIDRSPACRVPGFADRLCSLERRNWIAIFVAVALGVVVVELYELVSP